MGTKFNVDEWLKLINVWDPKYDFVMHNDHWLTLDWCQSCDKCLSNTKKHELANITSSPKASIALFAATSSPVAPVLETAPAFASGFSKHQEPQGETGQNDKRTITPPPQPPPPETVIPVTPIAPAHIANKAFMTPYTTSKYHDTFTRTAGQNTASKYNDTFTRSTRQSTKKLLNQTTNQDLINLNETFDLYKSALAESPTETLAGGEVNLPDGRRQVLSNFELLTNNQNNGTSDYNPASLHGELENLAEYSQPVSSRIPRIPVRSSRN